MAVEGIGASSSLLSSTGAVSSVCMSAWKGRSSPAAAMAASMPPYGMHTPAGALKQAAPWSTASAAILLSSAHEKVFAPPT
eukprot:1178479-Prorocentrum_minimum.AAC.1